MKNIFICTDGTWNTLTQEHNGVFSPTNVAIMSRIILSNDKQLVYYDEGVGTGDWCDKIIGGATGAGLDENIKQAYRFIVDHYQAGDNIILFGFSRGAYTARSLAGLIVKAGILRKKYIGSVDKVFKSYRKQHDLIKAYVENYCHPESQKIFFLGVWDTVSALGLPLFNFSTKRRYKFHDTKLSPDIEHAYHAVAIDEKRITFPVILWDGDTITNRKTAEQIAFAGVHCNIGGGYAKKGLSDTTLDWMIKKMQCVTPGLSLDTNYITNKIRPNLRCKLYNSAIGLYSLSRVFPKIRKKVRNIKKHPSVCKRFNNKSTKYNPKNVTCP